MPGGALGSGHSRCPGSVQSQKRNLRYGPHWKYHRPPTRGSYPIHQRGGHMGHSAPPSVPRQYGGFGQIVPESGSAGLPHTVGHAPWVGRQHTGPLILPVMGGEPAAF